MKKEFVTTWTQDKVHVDSKPQTIAKEAFYNKVGEYTNTAECILPDDITFRDLLGFVGKRTKVTIEVIPW